MQQLWWSCRRHTHVEQVNQIMSECRYRRCRGWIHLTYIIGRPSWARNLISFATSPPGFVHRLPCLNVTFYKVHQTLHKVNAVQAWKRSEFLDQLRNFALTRMSIFCILCWDIKIYRTDEVHKYLKIQLRSFLGHR